MILIAEHPLYQVVFSVELYCTTMSESDS